MNTNRLNPAYLAIGRILRPHGIRGELRLNVLTDYPERISQIKTIYIGPDPAQSEATPYTVKSTRFNNEYLLLGLEEISDRTDAETLRGLYVMVDLEHAVPLEEDEFYLYQVIGLTVMTRDGDELGIISDVIETGANDVYVVKGRRYGEILIPAHSETLIDIDFERGVVTVQLPDGLLPETK